MNRSANLRCLVVGVILSAASAALACDWASGYFFQITNLRGSLVGVSRGDPRQMIKWMRQHVNQGNETLTLYEYRWPARLEELKVVSTVKADANGHFDFGNVAKGHYRLVIDTPWRGQDIYDVEIVQSKIRTSSVTIDISPNLPDCSGGHEFIVHAE